MPLLGEPDQGESSHRDGESSFFRPSGSVSMVLPWKIVLWDKRLEWLGEDGPIGRIPTPFQGGEDGESR